MIDLEADIAVSDLVDEKFASLALTPFEGAWALVLRRVKERSYILLPDALLAYADERAAMNFGRHDETTAVFIEACLFHIKRREWQHINDLIREYKGLMNNEHVRLRETQCSGCGKEYRADKWVCFDCNQRRKLVDTRRIQVADARISLAWDDWRVALDAIKPLSNTKDGPRIMVMAERAMQLLKFEIDKKHISMSNYLASLEWFIDIGRYDFVWKMTRQIMLVFHELPGREICGAKATRCDHCLFYFGGEFKDHWQCPQCSRMRHVCMNSFTNQKGRCASHKTGSNGYYGFVDNNLSESYELYANDPDLVSTQRQIALMDTRINQLTMSMGGYDAETLRKELEFDLQRIGVHKSDLDKAISHDNPDPDEIEAIAREMLATMETFDRATGRANTEQRNWEEISTLLKGRKDQVDSEVKKQIAQQYTIPISTYIQALTGLATLFVQRLSIISDQGIQMQIRELVAADTQRMLQAETIDGEFVLNESPADVQGGYVDGEVVKMDTGVST